MSDNVFPIMAERHYLAALVQDIKEAVYSRVWQISVTEAIGALEMAKIELLEEQRGN